MDKVPSGFKIVRVTLDTLESAIEGVRQYFHDESISIGVELTSERGAVEEMENLCRRAAADGVSLIAMDEKTGEVAGTLINRIQTKGQRFYEEFLKDAKYENSRVMLSSIISICSTPNIFDHYEVDSVFEMMFLSVKPEYRRKNIGQSLLFAVMNLARDIKDGKADAHPFGPSISDVRVSVRPKVIASHATSPITHKVCLRLGFEDLKVTKFAEFTFKDRSFASRIGNDNAIVIFVATRL